MLDIKIKDIVLFKVRRKLTYPNIVLLIFFFVSIAILGFSTMPINKIYKLLLDNSAYMYFLTFGATLILSIKEIDLSMYSNITLSSVLTSIITSKINTDNFLLSFIFLFAFILIFQLFNYFLIFKRKIPSLIATIGTNFLYFGLASFFYTAIGSSIGSFKVPKQFYLLKNNMLLLTIIIIVVYVLTYLIMEYTKLRLFITSIGQNIKTATYSNFNIDKYRLITFILSSFFYSIGAFVLIGTFDNFTPSGINSDIIIIIATAVLSGANIDGGRLPIFFVLLGVTIYALFTIIIDSIFELTQLDDFLIGLMLIIYLFVYYLKSKTEIL